VKLRHGLEAAAHRARRGGRRLLKQISTGDRTILGKISKQGNRYLRVLLYGGADEAQKAEEHNFRRLGSGTVLLRLFKPLALFQLTTSDAHQDRYRAALVQFA
jgi:transposase